METTVSTFSSTHVVPRLLVALGCLLMLLSVFPSAGQKAQATSTVTSGLLLHLDAANTSSYAGSGSTWFDLSGANMNATLFGAPTVQPSTSNSPRRLVLGTGNYATLPSGFANFTSGITIQATVDFGSAEHFERIIDLARDSDGGSHTRPDADESENVFFSRYGVSDTLILGIWGAGVARGDCTATNAITSGVHSYAVTVAPSGGSTTCTMYRDGVALGGISNTIASMPNNITRDVNYVGRSNWLADPDFGDSIKSVLVYNRALSSAEILQNYSSDSEPTAPSAVTVSSTTTTQASLTWTAPTSAGSSNITDYVVQYSLNNSSWNTFAEGVSTATSATVTGLTSGTPYYFRVGAINSFGTSSYSTAATASTDTTTTVAPTTTTVAPTTTTVAPTTTLRSPTTTASSVVVNSIPNSTTTTLSSILTTSTLLNNAATSVPSTSTSTTTTLPATIQNLVAGP